MTITILSGAPTTLERAKIFLGIAGDSKDSLITMLINQSTGIIERYTKRTLKEATYTDEVYVGNGQSKLVLRQFPVSALSAVKEAQNAVDSAPSFTTLNSSTYRFTDDGIIERLDAIFLEGYQYKLTYTAGYKIDFTQENTAAAHDLPQELEYACHKLVARLFNTRRAEGFNTSRQGDTAVGIRDEILDADVKGILEKYAAPTI